MGKVGPPQPCTKDLSRVAEKALASVEMKHDLPNAPTGVSRRSEMQPKLASNLFSRVWLPADRTRFDSDRHHLLDNWHDEAISRLGDQDLEEGNCLAMARCRAGGETDGGGPWSL